MRRIQTGEGGYFIGAMYPGHTRFLSRGLRQHLVSVNTGVLFSDPQKYHDLTQWTHNTHIMHTDAPLRAAAG
jgi:hypothetical protein